MDQLPAETVLPVHVSDVLLEEFELLHPGEELPDRTWDITEEDLLERGLAALQDPSSSLAHRLAMVGWSGGGSILWFLQSLIRKSLLPIPVP